MTPIFETHAHTHARMQAHTHTHTHNRAHARTHARTQSHTHTHTHSVENWGGGGGAKRTSRDHRRKVKCETQSHYLSGNVSRTICYNHQPAPPSPPTPLSPSLFPHMPLTPFLFSFCLHSFRTALEKCTHLYDGT